MSDKQQYYLNDAQSYMMRLMPRDLVAVCGRGFGKGCIQAGRLKTAFQGMPGSMGGFVAPSVKRCLTNILPSALIHLERWGFKRDIHYIIGKKPWKALKWKQPVFTPANWENTLAFYNGSVCNIISQDRSGTSNSFSLDYLIIDEAKFINFEQLKDETFQANRGNKALFGKFYMHHGMTITSDMPVTKAGSWFLRYQDSMDPELVKLMEALTCEIWLTKQRGLKHPEREQYYRNRLRQLQTELDFCRSRCLLYKEYSSIENLAILGEDFIRQAKRDLPPLTFQTSIMCRRIGISADGFYGGMTPDNLYTAPNESVLNLHNLSEGKLEKVDCRSDADLDPNLPLIIAGDANELINWLVVGQVKDGKLRILKSFYTKYERKMEECVDDVIEYYHCHKCKRVIFYYDSTFIKNSYGTHAATFRNIIVGAFRKHQWSVTAKYLGNPMGHVEKCELINRMFRGRAKHHILINRDNNPDLLISIQSAGVYNGKKDKRGEKLAETEEDKLEGRTDGSDAFDTVCIGVERYPVAVASQGTAVTISK